MAEQQGGARPAMRVLFIVPEGGRARSDQDGGGREDKFVEISAAWETQSGGFRFQLDAVPAALLRGESVTFVLTPVREREQSNQRPAPRGGRR